MWREQQERSGEMVRGRLPGGQVPFGALFFFFFLPPRRLSCCCCCCCCVCCCCYCCIAILLMCCHCRWPVSGSQDSDTRFCRLVGLSVGRSSLALPVLRIFIVQCAFQSTTTTSRTDYDDSRRSSSSRAPVSKYNHLYL